MNWQPIETAPRDESRILVFIDDPVSKVQRHAFGHCYGSGCVIAEGYNGDWRITHWMPLPESPAAKKCIHCDPTFVPQGPGDWCGCECHKNTSQF